MTRSDSQPKERILDAAERVILRDGGPPTVEAVAAEAGLSKGGLFHHFANKGELAEHLVGRAIGRCRESFCPGDGTAGFHLFDRQPWKEECGQSLRAALILAFGCPEVLGRIRTFRGEIRSALEAEGFPEETVAIRMILFDGIWLGEVLGPGSAYPHAGEDPGDKFEEDLAAGLE